MLLYEQGKSYWTIARRFHEYRRVNPSIGAVAVRDMQRLSNECSSEAVRKRIHGFIARNRQELPGNSPNDSGPRRA